MDGLGIEAAEQAAAKGKYAGRLTRDFLEDKVGRRVFETLRELELTNLRVRDLGLVFMAPDFANLAELNLDGNYIADAAGLATLPGLQVLRLNNNRLEVERGCKLDPGLKAPRHHPAFHKL